MLVQPIEISAKRKQFILQSVDVPLSSHHHYRYANLLQLISLPYNKITPHTIKVVGVYANKLCKGCSAGSSQAESGL